MRAGERVTDSAGVTCEYVRIEDLQPGDVVIIGWRSTVKRIETRDGEDGREARIVWVMPTTGHPKYPDGELADQWNRCGTLTPREVTT